MKRHLSLLLSLWALAWAGGCAHTHTPGGSPIVVAITNPFTSVQTGTGSVTLNAAVANDGGKHGVKWELTVANQACSPTCGTLVAKGDPSFSAVYTPPTKQPLNLKATITAVSAEQQSAIYTFNFDIVPLVTVTIPNKFTSILAGSQPVIVNANVQYDNSNQGVTWTLTAGGQPCSPACGTILSAAAPSLTAQYTPPTAAPTGANANPTITATSVSNTGQNDSFSFNVTSPVTLVKGTYSFLLNGYSLSGSPMVMAGSLTLDGTGKITAGAIDIDNGGGITTIAGPLNGNYTADITFHGVVRGMLNVTNYTFPNSQNSISLSYVLSADGKTGRVVEFDGSGFINSGTIELQDPAALSAANPANTYIFHLSSDAPVKGRTAAIGQLVLSSTGVTSGLIDQVRAGGVTPQYVDQVISAGALTKPDSNGRGTFTLNVGADAFTFAYYVVDATKLNLIQTDQGLTFGTAFSGTAKVQKTLTANSIVTTSVLYGTGMDVNPTTLAIGPISYIGLLRVNQPTQGQPNYPYQLQFDRNDLGNILQSHPNIGTIDTFNPTSGRGVIDSTDGFNQGFITTGVVYLDDTGDGFFLDLDPSPVVAPPTGPIVNYGLSGVIVPQSAGPFTASTFGGNILAGFGGSAIPLLPNFAGVLNVDSSGQNYTAIGDLTDQTRGNLPGVTFSSQLQVSNFSTGYGQIGFPGGLFGDFNVVGSNELSTLYVIGPNRFVSIGMRSGTQSGVNIFTPQ